MKSKPPIRRRWYLDTAVSAELLRKWASTPKSFGTLDTMLLVDASLTLRFDASTGRVLRVKVLPSEDDNSIILRAVGDALYTEAAAKA